ncbi:MAG: hypothetical protein AB7P03_28355 [Kofleriaceae bacterium]
MRAIHMVLWCCLAGSLLVAGCKRDDRAAGATALASATWPAEPSDGAPLAIEMVSIVSTGKRGEAKLRVFNFTDKAVRQVRGTIQFLDAAGAELTRDSFLQADPRDVVARKAASEFTAGAAIPERATSAKIAIRSVEFGDGSTWEHRK